MWIKYIYQLLHKVEVPRTLCIHKERMKYVDHNAFGGASKDGTAALFSNKSTVRYSMGWSVKERYYYTKTCIGGYIHGHIHWKMPRLQTVRK